MNDEDKPDSHPAQAEAASSSNSAGGICERRKCIFSTQEEGGDGDTAALKRWVRQRVRARRGVKDADGEVN